MNSSSAQVSTPLSISPSELQTRLQSSPNLELLDVRTQPEHASVHVPGVTLIPLDTLNPADYLAKRSRPEQPIYVFCQAGGRAKKAIDMFRSVGFENCVLVEGGTQAWIDAGLPVVRGESSVLPLMRQVQIVIGFVSASGAALALSTDKRFALIPLLTGCGLLFAGITGTCGLALLLAKMPWNKKSAPTQGTKPSCCS